MYDKRTGKMCQLHEQNTELDASFDVIVGTMRLQQKLRCLNSGPHAQITTTVNFSKHNSAFVNLEGLADNSLLLTFKILSAIQITQVEPNAIQNSGTNGARVKDALNNGTSANGIFLKGTSVQEKHKKLGSKPILRQEVLGFFPDNQTNECPLFKVVNANLDMEKTMQLHLPKDRISSWMTVGLILLTFREITATIWHRITTQQKGKDVAGLNWVQVREQTAQISVVMTLEAKRRVQAALDKERARSTAIMQQAVYLGLQGDPTGRYIGFSARVRPAQYGQLRAGDLGFRG
ncbi:uncharacterized protein N7477_000729 [Penicillium maclennaniae]|uniref:uncharacterized protein n=1 Tax=Penicillium maclennaniae TaxID=1343394 RepID=UPI0025418013|nr:uncharacterized protein N7477_000729 [Penicillium maclennaniae]KAJ5684384.1 hypothetical protein N7477_000729 [Penicillium maclennaniae]